MEQKYYFEIDTLGLLHVVILPNRDIKGLDWMIDGWLESDAQDGVEALKDMKNFIEDSSKDEEVFSSNAYDLTMRKDYCTITSIFDCYSEQYCIVPTLLLYEILENWIPKRAAAEEARINKHKS